MPSFIGSELGTEKRNAFSVDKSFQNLSTFNLEKKTTVSIKLPNNAEILSP